MKKGVLTLFITIGGIIGGYVPVWLFHVSGLSLWSLLCGAIGSLVGIWAAVKVSDYVEG